MIITKFFRRERSLTDIFSVVVIAIGRLIAVKQVGNKLQDDVDCKSPKSPLPNFRHSNRINQMP